MKIRAPASSILTERKGAAMRALFRLLRIIGAARPASRDPKAMGKRHTRRAVLRRIRRVFR